MFVGPWISFGITCSSTVLIGVFLLYAQGSGLVLARGALTEIFAVASSVGVLLGLSHALWMSRYQTELRRLIAHIDAKKNSRTVSGMPRLAMGLDRVVESVNNLGSNYQEHFQQLESKRRELEVQIRLAEAERQYAESILNAIDDAVVVTDHFNELAMVNKAAARILDFDMNGSLHRPLERVVRDEKLVNMMKDTRHATMKSVHPRHVEHEIEQHGRTSIFDVTLSAIGGSTDSGAISNEHGVVAVLRDITREKQVAEMKSDFVANVSHELKTPLSSIMAYMEMLIDGEAGDAETCAEFYNIIQGETNRLQRLIDNILNISRIESGVVRVLRDQFSLATLVKDVIDVMQPQARSKQLTLTAGSFPPVCLVFADRDMLWQATLNLISNAIKYTPVGGRVKVDIQENTDVHTVSVQVADTGVGIPTEAIPHLFNKFYRVSDHKKIAKGTGLGLNLVQQIIETVHGGRVTIQSTVNKGSTFMYTLPLADNVL